MILPSNVLRIIADAAVQFTDDESAALQMIRRRVTSLPDARALADHALCDVLESELKDMIHMQRRKTRP